MPDTKTPETFNANAGNGAADPALEFDPAEFMEFLGDLEWSEEEKIEYLALIWNIVCEFVALGFNVHPLQQTQNSCGKPGAPGLKAPGHSESGVESLRAYLQENQFGVDAAETRAPAEREET